MNTILRFHFILFIALSNLFSYSLFSENETQTSPIIYLTWQHQPDTTMTIQWITSKKNRDDVISYRQEGSNEWLSYIGTHFSIPEDNPYYIHRVELTQLQPGKTYQFKIGQSDPVYKFSTMPSDIKSPIRFVVGGDIYHDTIEIVKEMNTQAALASPHFAIAGGDLAYTSSAYSIFQNWGFSKEKFKRWLTWLSAWSETMVTPDGRLIPIIPVLGNHDVMGRFDQTPEQAKIYHALFGLPGYYVIDFSNYMSLIILDSDHTHPVKGKQTQWLSNTLYNRSKVPHKFAAYHVGAYPSVRSYHGERHRTIRKHWVPLFEQYGLNVAFEHHDHAYKRTHPILNGQISPNGVVYIGDGAWGIEKPREPETDRWYILKGISSRNITIVTIDKDTRYFKAIDSNGKILDEFSQKNIY
jgi:hypothetical protein